MNNKSDAEFYQPQTHLQDRVEICDAGKLDFSAADSVIDDLATEFVQRLPSELTDIEAALVALEETPGDASKRMILFRLVHDLKGQAGTFDYLLITVIGNDLCRFIERPIALSPRCLKVAWFHVDAMKRVVAKGMTGDGNGHGLKMIDTLHRMTQKVLQE